MTPTDLFVFLKSEDRVHVPTLYGEGALQCAKKGARTGASKGARFVFPALLNFKKRSEGVCFAKRHFFREEV